MANIAIKKLLNPDSHHEYLDSYNEVGLKAYQEYKEAYKEYKAAKQALDNLSEHMAERARELDMLRFQIDEIEEAGLQPGEDEAIAEELKRLD